MGRHTQHQILSAYLDGELSARACRAVDAHLGSCPACRERLGSLRRLSAAVRELPGSEPRADMLRNITRELGLGGPVSGTVRPWWTGLFPQSAGGRLAWTGACALLLILGALWLMSPAPVTEQAAVIVTPEAPVKTVKAPVHRHPAVTVVPAVPDPQAVLAPEQGSPALDTARVDGPTPVPSAVAENAAAAPEARPFQHAEFAGQAPSSVASASGAAPATGSRIAAELTPTTGPIQDPTPVLTPVLPREDRVEVRNNVIDPTRGGAVQLILSVARPCRVRVTVYNRQGEMIRVLVDQPRDAGVYQDSWNGRNDSGSVVNAGYYIIQVQTETLNVNKQVVVVK